MSFIDDPAGQDETSFGIITRENLTERLESQAEPTALQTCMDIMGEPDKKLALSAARTVFELTGRLDKKPVSNVQNNFNLSREAFDKITEGASTVLSRMRNVNEQKEISE